MARYRTPVLQKRGLIRLSAVKVVGQLVGILHGDAGPSGEIVTPFMEQQQLARKLGLALTLIRNKIRD